MNSLGFQYADDVLSGKQIACQYVQQACQRFMDDLQRKDFVFKSNKVNRVVKFIADLQHGAGEHENKHFILEPWQHFIIMNLYGFYWKKSGKRRFKYSYIEMAKKNGKTAFSSARCLYHLSYDGEGAAEVLQVANSKEQAFIAYRITKGFIKKLDPQERFFKRFRSDILFPLNDSFLKVLATDDTKMDGYNCNFGLIDEWHSAVNSRTRDVIRSGQAMRENPMLDTITTAGFDKDTPCYELRTTCTEILKGVKKDDSMFTIIYTLDEVDKWQDPKVWIKSNPNLGVTVHEDFLQQQVHQAENNPSDEVGVRTKNLNEWVDSKETWIPDKYILDATKKVNPKEKELYVGVDLASVQDLTAVAYHWVEKGRHKFKIDYYLPSESLQTRPDKELYKEWAMQKHIIITPGNVTDYEYITRDLLEKHKDNYIVKVGYDVYNATQWAIIATNENLPLEPCSQSIGNFNKPTREFERLMMKGEVDMDDNPVTRYCLRNVQLRMDHNGNVKPDKKQNKKKIDGVTAALQALTMYQAHANTYIGSIF